MNLSVVVEQIDKQEVIFDECASNEWLWEVRDWHREVVDSYFLIDVQLSLINFFLSSLVFSEDSKFVISIINISKSKLASSRILFNILSGVCCEIELEIRQKCIMRLFVFSLRR